MAAEAFQRHWDWRQVSLDVSGVLSYLVIGVALWVGILLQLRPKLVTYLGLGSADSQVLVVVLVGASAWALWLLASRLGPVSENAAELVWLPSARQRNWQLAVTWLSLTVVASLVAVTSVTLVAAGGRWLWVLVAPLSIMVGIPLLAGAQRLGWEPWARAILTGLGGALVAAMGGQALFPASWIAVAVTVATAVVVTGLQMIGQARRLRVPAQMIPRWSLLRAAAFRDALTGVTQLFDSTSALVYQDIYSVVRKRRLPLPALHLASRTGLRRLISYLLPGLVVVVTAAFFSRTTTPTVGMWLSFVGGALVTQHLAPGWTDWITAPALRRMFNARWWDSLALLLATLLPPVLATVLAIYACVSFTARPGGAALGMSAYLLAVLLPVWVLADISIETTTTASDGGFMVTPDGLVMPTQILSRLGTGTAGAAIVASVAVIWSTFAGLMVLLMLAAMGLFSGLNRWRKARRTRS